MEYLKKPTLLPKVIKLFKQGKTQKAIAIECNLTEKTVGEWLRPVKKARDETIELITALRARLLKLSENGTADEIAKVTDSIEKLQKMWFMPENLLSHQ